VSGAQRTYLHAVCKGGHGDKMEKRARLYQVRGRVQGVGFRYFVQRVAADLGLTGYVKNLDDGRVEVYAAGSEAELSQLESRLWKGPPSADVRGVDLQEAPVHRYDSFRIDPSW
jgi:acylphosphatase